MDEKLAVEYEKIFKEILDYFKGKELISQELLLTIKDLTNARFIREFGEFDNDVLDGFAIRAFMKFSGPITIEKTYSLKGKKISATFGENLPKFKFFWPRYNRFLKEVKQWGDETRASIDTSTSEILKLLGNPQSTEFDVRGLVLGYVQSGKTANFTGLINKAFDVGYKLVIVLAGMHNDLREQTQIRLEEEIVGSIDPKTGEKIGVAKIRHDGPIVATWTTRDRDVSISDSGKRHNLSVPNLLVVKKNKDVLETLKELLAQSTRLSKENADVPVLIIDDEADQASIDTSNPNKNEDPKTINRLIREILEVFNKKSYVGYTATPFANLLIRKSVEHDSAGLDLYPKDFVVALPKPKGYCGPAEYFNVTGYEEDDKPLFIRHIEQSELDIFDSIKTTSDAEKFKTVPPAMEKAILSFLITIAVRNLRGQQGQHNSMLIHTSRFTDAQGVMQKVVSDHFENMKNDVLFGENYLLKLKHLYLTDHVIVQREFDESLEVFEWASVEQVIKDVIKSIYILEINGKSGQALEYQKYKDEGLNVIAIGGEKLSRGLTLEGLSVSYYYRGTNMYDTLMQMGRWFGYRTGYMDLCRIFTSENIADNFEHMARVMVELRQEFERVAETPGMTPETYAVKMLDHSKMMVTSLTKMKSGARLYNHSGTTRQTRIFDAREEVFNINMAATKELVNEVGTAFKYITGGTNYYIAKDIDSKYVIKFLQKYQTAASVNKVNSTELAQYIKRLNEQDKLTKFNIVIVGDTPKTLSKSACLEEFPVKLGHLRLASSVIRAKNKQGVKGAYTVDLGAIVASKQDYIDLPEATQEARNKSNPAILIYPLHPEVPRFKALDIGFNETFVPIGFAISFPRVFEQYIDEHGRVCEKDGDYIINATVKGEFL